MYDNLLNCRDDPFFADLPLLHLQMQPLTMESTFQGLR